MTANNNWEEQLVFNIIVSTDETSSTIYTLWTSIHFTTHVSMLRISATKLNYMNCTSFLGALWLNMAADCKGA
jgi:hypothetical protein